MKVFSPFLNGDTTTSGSFTLPQHPTASAIINPNTGSIYHDTTDGVVRVYTGIQWQVVGEQTTSAAPTVPASADIEYLLVAGGGGAGSTHGGGGGAGGYLSSSLASVTSGSSFTVTVGGGGAGSVWNTANGTSGVDSSIAGATISTITATGGGGGGQGYTSAAIGLDGGSGGGGGANTSNASTLSGGANTAGQGFSGGSGYGGGISTAAAGGGGGAGAIGNNGSAGNGGNGGAGKQSNITGTLTYYGGGGGAGSDQGTAGSAGTGGGGAGNHNGNGTSGTSNTGGGAGGGGGGYGNGGTGGSGVVIFAYDSGSINGAGGIIGDAGNGRKYHQFNSSDTFTVGSTSDFQIVSDSLLLHYDAGNFSSRGASTVTDLSGNGYNGTTVNSPTLNDYSYTFNGSNTYINTNNQLLSNNSSFSYSLWIKFSTSQSGRTLVGRHNDATGGASIGIDDGTANKVKFHLNSYSTQRVNSTGTINDGNWKYLVGTWDTSTLKLYINGSLDNSATPASTSLTFPSLNMQIGRWVGGNSQYFNGEIAIIQIYTKALSAAEILQNYNATKTNFV